MRRETATLGLLFMGACTGEVRDSEPTWTLVATQSGALMDAEHPEFGAYPNPNEHKSLKMVLTHKGELCGEEDGQRVCGGLLDGLPYEARMRVRDGSACVAVQDIFGHAVIERCGTQLLSGTVAANASSDATCYSAVREDGSPCQLCANSDGWVVENTCESEAVDSTDGGIDDDGGNGGSTGEVCSSHESAFVAGFDAMLDEANQGLTKMGLVGVFVTPPADIAALAPPEDNSAHMQSLCAWAEHGHHRPEWSPNFVYGDAAIEECVQEGRCRIAQMLRLATLEACAALTQDCRKSSQEVGIVTAGVFVLKQLCHEEPDAPPSHNPPSSDPPSDVDGGAPSDSNGGDGDEGPVVVFSAGGGAELGDREFICRGSPLVVDVEGDGIALRGVEREHSFALLNELPVTSGWLLGSDDAFVALDRNGDGAIDSGSELFGEMTDGFAPDGFTALARLDDNLDGVLDARDSAFAQLLLWRDDGDARSESSELSALSSVIDAVRLDAQSGGQLDSFGNELGLLGEVRMTDGSTRSVVDVWFRVQAR